MPKPAARETGEKSSPGTPTRRRAYRLVLWYVVVGSLWLLVTDGIVGHFVHDLRRAEVLDVVADCLYVVISALMLALLQERYFREIRRTAHMLQENEARLRVIGDGLPDCIVYQYTRDADGKPRFNYASAGVERVFGLKPADVLDDGGRIFALFDPAQLPPYAAAKMESARQMTDFDMELRVQRTDGQTRLIHARSRPRRDEQGRIVWDGFATDVTERRRIESDQMAAVARYRSLFDNMLNGLAHCRIVVEDGKAVDFLYLDVNPAFRKLTGLANVVGKLATEVMPGVRTADPKLMATCGRVAVTGVPEQFETHLETLKNWFAISVYCPAQEHFVAVFDVITERKRAEEALRLSEMKFARAFANNPAGIALTRLEDGVVFDVNDTWVALHGFSRAEIVGQSARALWLSSESAVQFVRELRETGAFRGLQEFRKKSGERFVAEISSQVLTIEDEQVVLSTLLDVTARQRAEAALLRSQADLAAAQKLAKLGNWRFDIATNTVEWSDELYRIFEIKKIGSDGSYEVFLECVLPADRPLVRETNAKARADGQSFQIEYRIQTRAGNLKTIREVGHALKDAAGAVAGLFGVAQDITERKQVAEALRRSEQNYREIFNATNEAIVIHDAATGGVMDINDTFLRMHGYSSKDDFLADKFGKLMDSDSPYNWEEARRRVRLAIEEGPQVFEWLDHRKNGELFWAEVSLRSTQIGGVACVLAVGRDITERKQAETALRQSEEQFRAMFETSSVGMGQGDPHTGRLMRVNRKLCEITGYSEAELLQLKVPDITHPGDREHDWELYQRVVQGAAPNYHIEKRYVRKDGKVVWVSVHMNVVRDAAGQPLRTMATIEDITERRKSEEERLRLSTALEQTSESIVITDLAGMILYVNPAFERVSGYSRREAIGQNPRVLKSGRHDAAFYKQLWATLARGEVWHGHFVNRRKDGTFYDEEATISPVRDASGKVVNYMAIKLDVSREMDLENQFRQAQKLEAIGQLAGGVAHDFNNILTSIMMQIALGSMGDDLSADTKESFEQIRRDADRAASLTRQLLLFSRRQVMQSQDLDLNQVVTNLAKMLQRIIGEDVRLQLNLHPAPLLTHADAGMLDQVAMNLAVNARDAMPQGGQLVIATSEIIVDEALARHQTDAAPGRYICLRVTDTGCGIPPEVLPRIFEPFFTTKETGKGTGLGLATVFGIVKQHRGWITVDSQPGQGTTFKVFLPAIAAAAALAVGEVRSQPRGGTETILLAEDESMVRRSVGSILKRNGYQVLEAANGEAALRIWGEHRARVALLLTDLVMPGGVTGQQLARRLQADNPSLKVIYTSGYSAEIAGRELHLQNGENFIQKPLQSEELLKTVRTCLDRATG